MINILRQLLSLMKIKMEKNEQKSLEKEIEDKIEDQKIMKIKFEGEE